MQFEQILAVVDEVLSAEFRQDVFSKNLHQKEWLTQKAHLHHQLIQRLQLTQDSLIPIKFGSVFEQIENIQQLLAFNKVKFEQQIQYLNGREEWNIKIYIDTE